MKYIRNILVLFSFCLLGQEYIIAQIGLELNQNQIENIDSIEHVIRAYFNDTEKELEYYVGVRTQYLRGSNEVQNFYFDKIIELNKKLDNTQRLMIAYGRKSIFYSNIGKVDSALSYIYKAQLLNSVARDTLVTGKLYHALGWYYHNIGSFKQAIQDYQKSIEIYDALGMEKESYSSKLKTVMIYKLLEDYDSVFAFYTVHRERNENNTSAIRSHAIAAFYSGHKKDYRELRDVYLKKVEESNEPGWYGPYLFNSMDCQEQSHFDCAIENYLKAKQIIDKSNNQKTKYFINIDIANEYERQQKYKEARAYLNDAYKIVDENNLNVYLEILCNKLIKVNTKLGDQDEASFYQVKLNDHDRHLELSQKLGEINDLKTKLYLSDYERQLSAVDIIREDAQKRFRYILLFLGFICLATIAFIVLYLKYKSMSKVLELKNKALDASLDDKVTLLQETHHRVKNNLQIIASLLNLQRKYTNDKKQTKTLIESRNRVKTMALIHQQLYQDKNLKGINVRSYIEILVMSLMSSYKVDQNQVKFINRVESIILDEDTLLSIGLIINELITNTLKYAFPDHEKGQISIELFEKGKTLHLIMKDNGVGTTQDIQLKNEKTFGYSLIRSLSKKLNGELQMISNNGTEITLEIKKYTKISLGD